MLSAIDDLQAAVRRWFEAGAIVFAPAPLEAGPWLMMIDAFAMPLILNTGSPVVHESAPALELDLSGVTPQFRSLDEFPEQAEVAILPTLKAQVPIKTALALYRKRTKFCWLTETDGWKSLPVEALLIELLLTRRVRPLLNRMTPKLRLNDSRVVTNMSRIIGRRRGRDPGTFGDPETAHIGGARPYEVTVTRRATGESLWANAIEQDHAAKPAKMDSRGKDEKLKIVQYIGSLSSGGAERQLCNLAIGLHQRGHDSRVVTTYEAAGDLGHYTHILESAGVRVRTACGYNNHNNSISTEAMESALRRIQWHLIASAPLQLQPFIANLALELAADMPDILHCWLDHPNIIGAMAAFAAGVPNILLSTRNSNPTHFPRLFSPYLEIWYHILSKSGRVHWLSNSHSGAESYAQWLGIDVSHIHVVLNGLFADHFERPTQEQRQRSRRQFGLAADAPVIAVVNRLSEEKQPDLMLKVICLLKAELPGLRVLVAGTGPLEAPMREIIRRRRLDDCVILAGRVRDINCVLCASDALLLTSTLEGCPNVALEAQHFGLPVVATRGGGTVDAVVHDVTGILCGVYDAVEIAQALRRILTDAERRERMGRAGQRFVDQCFAVDQMIDLTQAVYRLMLDGNPEHTRIVTPHPIHGFCGVNRSAPCGLGDSEDEPSVHDAPISHNGSPAPNGFASESDPPIIEIAPELSARMRAGEGAASSHSVQVQADEPLISSPPSIHNIQPQDDAQ